MCIRDRQLGVRAGIEVLHEEVAIVQGGHHLGAESGVDLRRDRNVDLAPPDLGLRAGLPDHVAVLGLSLIHI